MNEIRKLRIKKGLTQEELSKEIGVTQQQVSLYESGKIFPSMKVALKIACVLETTVEEIFLVKNTSLPW